MSYRYISKPDIVVAQLFKFQAFVQDKDGKPGFISFRDSAGFLGINEGYKSRVAEVARFELRADQWKEHHIGSGDIIANSSKKAMSKASNLVNANQQTDFRDRLDINHAKYRPDAERILYDIFRNPFCNEETAFANAVDVFGAKYDTIAFLFFIKDRSRFLPISTGHFDKGFARLGIEFSTSRKCSWENYQGYLEIIREIRDIMEEVLPMQGPPELIDAHSFVWLIQQDQFVNWEPDTEEG